ncbi:MAG: hypothetical protein QM765_04190 [Myxococcales bacterium]
MAASDDKSDKGKGRQLPLPLRVPAEPRPARPPSTPTAERTFRVIRGEGQKREETLHSRDDVVRLLVGTACDVMLKRITPDRAHEIQRRVDRIMRLFDRVPADPVATALLRRELDDLESIYRDGQGQRRNNGLKR